MKFFIPFIAVKSRVWPAKLQGMCLQASIVERACSFHSFRYVSLLFTSIPFRSTLFYDLGSPKRLPKNYMCIGKMMVAIAYSTCFRAAHSLRHPMRACIVLLFQMFADITHIFHSFLRMALIPHHISHTKLVMSLNDARHSSGRKKTLHRTLAVVCALFCTNARDVQP